jgi:hypothetical protein
MLVHYFQPYIVENIHQLFEVFYMQQHIFKLLLIYINTLLQFDVLLILIYVYLINLNLSYKYLIQNNLKIVIVKKIDQVLRC